MGNSLQNPYRQKTSPPQREQRVRAPAKNKPPAASLRWIRDLEAGLAALPVLNSVENMPVADFWGERFHIPQDHELVHVLQGRARIQFRKTSFDVGPGDTFVIPEGSSHRDVRIEGDTYRVVYVFFQWPAGAPVVKKLDPCVLLRAPDGVKAHLHLMMKDLDAEYAGENSGALNRMRLILLEVLLALVRYTQQTQPRVSEARQNVARERRQKLAAETRAYLRQHFGQALSLETMAAAFGVSPFHLSRSFSHEFGLSIIEMLTLIRIEHAQELLRTRLSIKEVAAQVGYADSNYFAKVFHRMRGMSPSEYQLKPH